MKIKETSRGARFVFIGMVMLFILFVIIRIIQEEVTRFPPVFSTGPTFIFSIWIIIILFSLTFLFILIRNIIKLYYDKHKHQPGTRFKNRLIFFFIAFSIIPTLLLFFFATEFVSRSVEQWFSTDIDSLMQEVEGANKAYYDSLTKELEHYAKLIAGQIREKRMYTEDNRFFLHNTLRRRMTEYKLDVISIYRNQKEIFTISMPHIPIQEYKDLPLESVYKGLSGESFLRIDQLRKGELSRNGHSFEIGANEKILVITGRYTPEGAIRNFQNLSAMAGKYSQLKVIKDPIKNTYVLLLIFITILIIFSASWLGFFLAKGITVPIEKLVSATSEITAGNLEVVIDYEAKDEFNTLIAAFNRMAMELREKQGKLERRTIELKHRRRIIENILNNITSGVIAFNTKGELVEINPEASKMLSLEGKEVVKKHFSQVLAENLYSEIKQLIEKAFTSKMKLFEKEIDIKIKSRITNLAVKITQIRNPINNRFSGLLVVLTDLSEMIKAQRMLVWREVAKRIAHEIKNPLTPIQISAQRIMRTFDQSDATLRRIVEDSLPIIQQELESIKKIADEFANFARLPEIKFSQGDLHQILENLVSVYSSVYQEVSFKVQFDVNLPPIIKLDSEQIRRVFVNLLDNAVEANDKKGEVEISTFYNLDSNFARVEIADNGPGLSDEDKQKLFIPYFSKKTSGTGLGLAISHNIVEEHHGLISVLDNNPQGARFVVELPV